MRRRFALVALVVSLTFGACTSTEPDPVEVSTSASEPPTPMTEETDGTGLIRSEDESTELRATSGEAAETEGGVDRVGADSPNDVTAPLLLAVETHDPELAEQALRMLSRNLAVWRRRPDPSLVEAVRMFSASSSAPLWRMVDGRYVPPAIELLLEIRDMAAVSRLTAAFADSAAEPALRGPRALVARDATPRATIEPESAGCDLHVDDVRRNGVAEVLVGSHEVGCGIEDHRLVVLFANEHIAVSADAIRVVEPNDAE